LMVERESRHETLRRAYDLFNARDIDGALALMEPEVLWPNVAEAKTIKGHAAVRDYWTRQWQEIDPSVDPVEFFEQGPWTVVRVHTVVRDLEGSVQIDQEIAHAYRFSPNGRVSEMVPYGSVREAREAITG
jgi:ketosteroid isomerase-like protein